jgi:hypothetical protein
MERIAAILRITILIIIRRAAGLVVTAPNPRRLMVFRIFILLSALIIS